MNSYHLPPGPKGQFLIGHFAPYARDPLGFLTRCAREYGDIVSLRVPGTRLYLLNHPRYIEQVLAETNQDFINHKGIRTSPALRLFRRALLTIEGLDWHNQRRLAFPAFRHDRIAEYASEMVACTETMLADWRDGEVRDIHQDLISLNLEIVARTLFKSDLSRVIPAIAAAFDVLKEGFVTRSWLRSFGAVLPLPNGRRFERAARDLDHIIEQIIRKRRANPPDDSSDLLSILMSAHDDQGRRISNERLRREVLTFLFTGHKAIGVALTWACHLVARHPRVQEKLQQELRATLGDRAVEAGDVKRLTYTTMVFQEALRLYPPGWAVGREAVRDCKIGGYDVPGGTQLVLSQWVTHRDPRFFDRAEEFWPERWNGDCARRVPRYAYFPFGGGARSCLGRAFAEMNAVLVLATMAQRFEIIAVDDEPVELIPSFALIPRGGIRIKLTARACQPPTRWPTPNSLSVRSDRAAEVVSPGNAYR